MEGGALFVALVPGTMSLQFKTPRRFTLLVFVAPDSMPVENSSSIFGKTSAAAMEGLWKADGRWCTFCRIGAQDHVTSVQDTKKVHAACFCGS